MDEAAAANDCLIDRIEGLLVEFDIDPRAARMMSDIDAYYEFRYGETDVEIRIGGVDREQSVEFSFSVCTLPNEIAFKALGLCQDDIASSGLAIEARLDESADVSERHLKLISRFSATDDRDLSTTMLYGLDMALSHRHEIRTRLLRF